MVKVRTYELFDIEWTEPHRHATWTNQGPFDRAWSILLRSGRAGRVVRRTFDAIVRPSMEAIMLPGIAEREVADASTVVEGAERREVVASVVVEAV